MSDSNPITQAVEAIQALAADMQKHANPAPVAGVPAPTPEQLRRQFNDKAQKARAIAEKLHGNASAWARDHLAQGDATDAAIVLDMALNQFNDSVDSLEVAA